MSKYTYKGVLNESLNNQSSQNKKIVKIPELQHIALLRR